MTDNVWRYAFDADYPAVVRELATEAMIFPCPGSDTKGLKTSAVWDTGATHSSISPKIAQELGLKPVDTTIVHGVNSAQAADVVVVSIGLANGLVLSDRRLSVCDIPGTDLLIGMDIIMMGDFVISNGGGKTLFSFAIPSFENKISFTEKADDVNRRLLGKKNNSD